MLEGRERHEAFSYPDTEYFYYIAATKFGWTIQETDEQPAHLVDWLMSIAAVSDEVRAKKNDTQ